MRRATAVIGANYGDEGKGLITDYLASHLPAPAVVVRFNGGAQAGHTVVTPEGKRHVFSHFGSGTLCGAQTYLAKHFVCNPLLFWREMRQIRDLGVDPEVGVDPRCFVTTPYDMLVNQMIEDQRDDRRHGSVGVGFGETIERNNHPGFKLWYSDMSERDALVDKLRVIRDRWFPARCAVLRVRTPPKDDGRMTDELLLKFAESCVAFYQRTVAAGAEFLERKDVVFEGAQGLALDMNSENFPHVTRSNTGLTNVAPLVRMLRLDLDVVYVTRTYLTKHGAGPLPGECELENPVRDETNIDHPYQGKLRFAPLDEDGLLGRIKKDVAENAPSVPWSLAVTWADWKDLHAPAETSLKGYGPRRDQVRRSAS